MAITRPIYLHFMDRELGESMSQSLDAALVEKIIKHLLFFTNARLYCGASLVCECPALQDFTFPFFSLFQNLIEHEAISIVSNHPTSGEFLESRQFLYGHDRNRYPMYFGGHPPLLDLAPITLKTESATGDLVESLGAWSMGGAGDGDWLVQVKNATADALRSRGEKAITVALFEEPIDEVAREPVRALGVVRRMISKKYTRHYMGILDADIVTGIFPLRFFDDLSLEFPVYDFDIMTVLSSGLGIHELHSKHWKEQEQYWTRLIAQRESELHNFRLGLRVRTLLIALRRFVANSRGFVKLSTYEILQTRVDAADILRRALTRLDFGLLDLSGTTSEQATERLNAVIGTLATNPQFQTVLKSVEDEEMSAPVCDVLIVVATDVERDALLSQASALTGRSSTPLFGKRRAYHGVGLIGGAHVVLVQSEMGSSGPGASQSTVTEAIDDLKPASVILLGIAFGVCPEEQPIGSVLVSRRLLAYEHQRIGTTEAGTPEIIVRGDRVPASSALVSRLHVAGATWREASVSFVLLLTGEKLVDNLDYRDQIRALSGNEAKGGEMEGEGLFTAAHERGVNWVVVKAVCDWADGNKREEKARRQNTAARSSASFIIHALGQGGFATGSLRD